MNRSNRLKTRNLEVKVRRIYDIRNGLVSYLGECTQNIDRLWIPVGKLSDILDNENVKSIIKEAGLYRAKLNGEIKYIGLASRSTSGGLRARLRDYLNGHSNKYESGRLMYQNRNNVDIDLLPFGDYPLASYVAKALECWLIFKHRKSVWNKISIKDLDEIENDPNLQKLWGE